RRGVEDVRRKMGDAAIAGKEIAAEQELEPLAVETHVTISVPGKMHRAQAMPDLDDIAIVQPAIGSEWLERQHRPADALQHTGNTRPAIIRRVAGVVIGIEAGRSDPRPRLAGERGDVQNVIEMAMGDDDAADGFALPTAPDDCAPQQRTSTDESSV